jgi:4-hydroxybenzoate polyprenyltransferase
MLGSMVTPSEVKEATPPAPLAVDLEGTLVKTDVAIEALLALARQDILLLLTCPFWLLGGRAALRREVARRVTLDIESLPFDRALVAYLERERRAGREIALVSATDGRIARAIAAHLGVFTHVIAGEGGEGISGRQKREALRAAFGGRAVLHATRRLGAAAWRRIGGAGEAHAGAAPEDTFDARRRWIAAIPRALRVHQWSKNALIFVPLLTSHRIFDLPLVARAIGAFVSFSLCASSVYILNDLVDLEADRRHASKRERPLASGDLGLTAGIVACALCLAAGAGASLLLPAPFRAVLALYYVLTIAYSMYLKRKLLVDVHLLAGLYTLRVLAGNAATGVPRSSWLLAFSMFFFLSLALLKRFSEVRDLAGRKLSAVAGRGYLARDADSLYGLGTASGFLGVSIMALYINSREVVALYRTPDVLWLLCPLLLYWVSRVWVLAARGRMHVDPVLFALRDRVSYAVGICAGGVMLLATLGFGH